MVLNVWNVVSKVNRLILKNTYDDIFLSKDHKNNYFLMDKDGYLYNRNGYLVNILDLSGLDIEDEYNELTSILDELSEKYKDLNFTVIRESLMYEEDLKIDDYLFLLKMRKTKCSTHSIYTKHLVRKVD